LRSPTHFPHSNRKIVLQPAGAVTGIGSLPTLASETAIQNVADLSPEIPFWPQLPQRSEQERAIGQCFGILTDRIKPRDEGYGYEVKDGFIDSVVDLLHHSRGSIEPANASAFDPFVDALEGGLFRKASAVKGQIEGPITLSAYLFYKGRPFLSDAALFAAVAFHVSQMLCWQIERLQSVTDLPVLLFVDEPALCLEVSGHGVSEDDRLSALGAILDVARARGAMAGLHCCAARPFQRMCRADPDILSFDAHEGLELFFGDPDVRAFTDRGGIVAYGMVPTLPELRPFDTASLFTRWLKAASLAGGPEVFAQRAMITATCGLGLLDHSAMVESFRLAQGLGTLIRGLAMS
jgi:hypothetical protein